MMYNELIKKYKKLKRKQISKPEKETRNSSSQVDFAPLALPSTHGTTDITGITTSAAPKGASDYHEMYCKILAEKLSDI